MKSAYVTLGVPGNASPDEIEVAFGRACRHYESHDLAQDRRLEKLEEVRTAYNVLRDTASRAAHDRKLSEAAARRAGMSQSGPGLNAGSAPAYSRPLLIMASLVLLVFAIGYTIQNKRENEKKEEAALALRAKLTAEAEEQRQEARLAQEEADRAQLALRAAQQESQFRQESNRAFANAQSAESRRNYEELQRQAAETREAQRKDYEARAREQQNARQAQQRLALDKARIRELCYINYRRYDC